MGKIRIVLTREGRFIEQRADLVNLLMLISEAEPSTPYKGQIMI